MSKAQSQINFFITQSKPITGRREKYAPLKDGGQGIPHIGNMLIVYRVKSLLKHSRGTLKGIPNIIFLNLGLKPQDVLMLTSIELNFLALTYKRCNSLFCHRAVLDYINFKEWNQFEQDTFPQIYEPLASSAQLKSEL